MNKIYIWLERIKVVKIMHKIKLYLKKLIYTLKSNLGPFISPILYIFLANFVLFLFPLIFNRDYETINKIAEFVIIGSGTLAILTFTYALVKGAKSGKYSDVVLSGELLLKSTLTFIIGLGFLLGVGLMLTSPSPITKLSLFSWDEIPGNDTGKLIEFLEQEYGIDWIKPAKIEKSDDGRAINISAKNNSLSLILSNEKTKVNLKIDDDRTDELIAKKENGKLNIYSKFFGRFAGYYDVVLYLIEMLILIIGVISLIISAFFLANGIGRLIKLLIEDPMREESNEN